MRFVTLIALMGVANFATAQTTSTPTSSPTQPPTAQQAAAPANGSTTGLLTPIPASGSVPMIYSTSYERAEAELRHRAAVRAYAKQFRDLRKKHFGKIKLETLRAEGIEQLKEFSDPASFHPMIKELEREQDDVRLAMLDHFAEHGEHGQAALAWVVIYDKDNAIRNEALRRMTMPAPEPVRYIVDRALRSSNVDVVNASAVMVNSLNITQAIPLLIFAQVAASDAATQQTSGDIAWIAIQTQRAYVAGLIPVVGDAAGGFQPQIGVVSEGVVLRINDAVVMEYRPFVHGALANMTSLDSGEQTAAMGYNIQQWCAWYNDKYVPFKNQQLAQQQQQSSPAAQAGS